MQRQKSDSVSPVVAIGIFLTIVAALAGLFTSRSRRETDARRRKSESFSRHITIGIFVAIVTAAVGYLVGIADDHRKKDIDFVDRQIERLYGPLYALSNATHVAKERLFASRQSCSPDYFDPGCPPNAQDVERWRRWLSKVLQPMNILMEKAIIENAQLIEGGEIYPAFAELILHVESYKATIARWKDTDENENPHFIEATENTAVVPFPKKFDQCIDQAFKAMRAKRERLNDSWIVLSATSADRSFVHHCGKSVESGN